MIENKYLFYKEPPKSLVLKVITTEPIQIIINTEAKTVPEDFLLDKDNILKVLF